MRTLLSKRALLATALFVSAALSGCGGGGGGQQSSAIPPSKTTPASKTNALATIVIPARIHSAKSRRPQWISPSTQSIDLNDTGPDGISGFDTQASLTTASPNCALVAGALTCTVPFAVVPGMNTITATLYDTTLPFRTANPLASQTLHVTIAEGATNPISFTLQGVPGELAEVAPNALLTSGAAGTATLAILGVDIDGNNISSGQFDTPVAMTTDDSTGGLSVAPGSILGPQNVTVNYNGNPNTATSFLTGCSATFGGNPNCNPGGALITVQVPSQTLYVAQTGTGQTLAYAPGSSLPIRTLNGPTDAVAVGSDGTTAHGAVSQYCWDIPGASITSFNTFSSTTTCVSGPATTMVPNINGLAFDAAGNVYVADTGSNSILVFPAGSNGNAAPVRTISGPATLLSSPLGITMDGAGKLYVSQGSSILVFASGANGNVSPTANIAGPSTQIVGIAGVAVDASGYIYTAGAGATTGQVSVFAPGSNGNVSPIRTISGTATGLAMNPIGIAVDNANNLFVADKNNNRILVFPASSSGNISPIRQFFSSNPAELAIRP